MNLRRLDLPTLRAAWWAHRAIRAARRQLRTAGYAQLTLPTLPQLPASAGRGVEAILRRQPHTCLERAVVLQRWLAAHGEPRDVIVGVRTSADGFGAHAWLDDEVGAIQSAGFEELVRLHP
jgi:hypothetical protein